ncbi:undecaprenyl-diphosphatase [Kutzneria viridogrisea]|uniref:Undecaprenyl-diphosphatase n=2 Tax=Kutzneria TaxID=43356 RepID=A0ABR6BN74_9PSEU|nr:bifunctional phosphatase PAP2/diacylglycerol kinase family protein [Kutzneria albida]AHH96420.1 putative glycerophosphatase [Kutzneria albida DSM 43870]MBA8928363.1 undecaprenyl-diphosphatase [Kutzneria viridogrisea]
MQRSAALPRSRADTVLKVISAAANHSLLWGAVAAVLAARKGPTRRAALRGIAAIAGASFTANAVGKTLLPRRRPAAELVAEHRRLVKRPTSSSFPSGHAASAAAFTTAVALESPKAAAVVAPLAAAVAYSRVHTGVHWGSDVACGALVGVAAGLLTRRWWPVVDEQAPPTRRRVEVPAFEQGEGLLFVVNPNSGPGEGDFSEQVRENWPSATVVLLDQDTDLDALVGEHGPKALGVAGGDGTVAAMAALATEHDLPLVVLPAGTLNHFARDLGVDAVQTARAAVRAGDGAAVDLGAVTVGGSEPRLFLNTASLGGYPDLVRLRDKHADRWGKWPAGAYALIRVLHEARPLDVTINGERLRVWMLFVGNNVYLPRGFAPLTRARLDTGLLDVRYLRADLPLSRTRFILAAVLGALHRSHVYRQADLPRLRVTVHSAPVAIATDGEVGEQATRFEFTARRAALVTYLPQLS